MLINILLRTSSVVVLLLILYQRHISIGGSDRHMRVGKGTMAVGALLVVLVFMRGLHHEGEVSFLYGVHLLVGSAFFISLFGAGLYGWKAFEDGNYGRIHHRYAKVVLPSLVMTLIFGLFSRVAK